MRFLECRGRCRLVMGMVVVVCAGALRYESPHPGGFQVDRLAVVCLQCDQRSATIMIDSGGAARGSIACAGLLNRGCDGNFMRWWRVHRTKRDYRAFQKS